MYMKHTMLKAISSLFFHKLIDNPEKHYIKKSELSTIRILQEALVQSILTTL